MLSKPMESVRTIFFTNSYSISGDASYWLKQLPPESLTSWTDIKNTFLCNFFDNAHAKELRSRIATFKSFQRDCLHHVFSEVQQLNTFFRGIALAY